MKFRDKIMYFWILLSGGAVLFGGSPERGIINVLLGVIINITLWYLLIKIVFWIYDKIKQARNK